jgi:hypothetical protein
MSDYGLGDQPEIKEPEIKIGETVWRDEDGTVIGKIVALSTLRVVVNFGNYISSFPIEDIRPAYLPPYLVLLAGQKETLVHQY